MPPSGPPRAPAPRHTVALARVAYVAVVFFATLADLHFDPSLADVSYRLARAFHVTLHLRDALDGLRNIALFAGLGATWVVTSPPGGGRRAAVLGTITGFWLSTLVESLQLFSPVRTASILDVTTNTVGAAVGGAVFLLVMTRLRADHRRPSFLELPAWVLAVSYALAAAMEAFAPLFGPERLPNLGGSPAARIGRALAAMHGWSLSDLPLIHVPIFFPVGVLAVAAMAEAGVPYAMGAAWATVVGAILCIIMEVVHGVVDQPIILGAILVHAVSIAVGAWAAAHWLYPLAGRADARRRARAVLIAFVTVIAIWSWRPFALQHHAAGLRAQFDPVHWIPLRAMAIRVDLFSVADVVAQFFLYLPLGAILAVWPLRTCGAWRHLAPACYLAVVMELGKIVIAGRFFDITHILIQIAGAAVGWTVARRSGYGVTDEVWRDAPPARAAAPVTPPA